MDKIYYNGNFIAKNKFSLSVENRGFRYGDSFFETIRCYNGKPIFWEEHYFRIAGSFCVLKMDPPSEFEIDRLNLIIKDLLNENNLMSCSARVRITFFRVSEGYYFPKKNDVCFIIEADKIVSEEYVINQTGLNTTIYKENILAKNHLGNIKSSNRLINIMASIYAKENSFDDCFLINVDQNIVESISGNVFILSDGIIQTPPLSDGCINGVLRSVLLKEKSLKILEKSISILDLFNAKEVFVTNVMVGVKWVGSIRSSIYKKDMSIRVLDILNRKYLI